MCPWFTQVLQKLSIMENVTAYCMTNIGDNLHLVVTDGA